LIISEFKNFCDLAGNCLFTPPFGVGGLGHISPKWRHQLSSRPKGPSLHGFTSFAPFRVKIGPTVWPVWRIEKKSRTVRKVTKWLYFTYLGRSPRWTDFNQVCMVCDVYDVIMYAKFHVEILMGYDFTGGRIFSFSYWFLHGPYNSAAQRRCLWNGAKYGLGYNWWLNHICRIQWHHFRPFRVTSNNGSGPLI